jgi:membrane fusion protein (multidrug efflux system)
MSEPNNKEAKETTKGKNNGRRWLGLGVLALVLAAGTAYGLHWWWWSRHHASTDDAYVQSTLAYVSPRVEGTIAQVLVHDNQRVEPGQVLVRLDPADFQVAVERARAALALAESQVAEQEAAVQSAAAALQLAQAELAQAKLDQGRSAELFQGGVIARQRLDRDDTALRVAQAKVQAAGQELVRAKAALGGEGGGGRPLVRERRAALQRAELDLSYCDIKAAMAGLVTRKRAEVGNFAKAGQPVLALVPAEGLYVEANFKETQLGRIRPGQKAEVVLDTYPDRPLTGHIESIMAGTGSAMSLLPPENATGNWVKVVQRVPVKVVLSANPGPLPPLRVGMSAAVTVNLD